MSIQLEMEEASTLTPPFEFRNTNYIKIQETVSRVDGYFLKDGNTSPQNLSAFADISLEPIDFKSGTEKSAEAVEDNEEARVGRINDFESRCEKSAINLAECTTADCLLKSGDQILATLKCNILEGHPSSTSPLDVKGLVNLSIIKHSDGFGKLQVSVAQGQYSFKADEYFSEFIATAATSFCLCCNSAKSFNDATMHMKYEMQKTLYAQDCSLPLSDSIIDAVVYRKAIVKNDASISSSESVKIDKKNLCVQCFDFCFDFCFGCEKCCFITCCCLFRCNPQYDCMAHCKKICSVDCCGIICNSLMCYKKEGKNVHHEVSFKAADKFIIGAEYNQKISKPKIEPVQELNPEDILWLVCPFFGGGVCCQYPDPLPVANNYWKDAKLPYLCAKAGSSPNDAPKDPEWEAKTEIVNEITISIQYRHLVDGATKTMKIIIHPDAEESVDNVYKNARLFTSELIRLRGPLSLEMKDRKLGKRILPTLEQVIKGEDTANKSRGFFGF